MSSKKYCYSLNEYIKNLFFSSSRILVLFMDRNFCHSTPTIYFIWETKYFDLDHCTIFQHIHSKVSTKYSKRCCERIIKFFNMSLKGIGAKCCFTEETRKRKRFFSFNTQGVKYSPLIYHRATIWSFEPEPRSILNDLVIKLTGPTD
jgi:hypothetical protein